MCIAKREEAGKEYIGLTTYDHECCVSFSLYFSVKFLFHCYFDQVDLHASNLTTEATYSTTIFAGKTPDDPIPTIVVCRFGPFDGKYSRLPVTRILANSNQNRFPLDFLHTFTVILPSITRSNFCFRSDRFYINLPLIM